MSSVWLDMWAVGRYCLRLSEEEVWKLTLKKFNALLKCYSASIERQDFHAGLICAVLANIYRDPKIKAYSPRDFMPGKKNDNKKQTPEEMLAIIKSMNVVRKKDA